MKCRDAPLFGKSTDSFESVAKAFSDYWDNFVSVQTFSWKDEYKLTEAPNRRVRRIMEKENKKLRDKAKREYNEQVRHLVKTVKRRDPRVAHYTEQQQLKRQERQARADERRRAAAAQRQKDAAEFLEQVDDNTDEQFAQIFGDLENEYNHDERQEFACVACNNQYKSARALANHEKSKKHLQAVAKLKRELMQDELMMNEEDIQSESSDVVDDDDDDDDDCVVVAVLEFVVVLAVVVVVVVVDSLLPIVDVVTPASPSLSSSS